MTARERIALHRQRLAAGLPAPIPRVQLAGQRYGRLVALEPAGTNAAGRTLWRCRCDCGQEHVTKTSSLRAGGTRSCGCLRSETSRRTALAGKGKRRHEPRLASEASGEILGGGL